MQSATTDPIIQAPTDATAKPANRQEVKTHILHQIEACQDKLTEADAPGTMTRDTAIALGALIISINHLANAVEALTEQVLA